MAIETLQTLSYSTGAKGWPSFYTYYPDYMIGMNSYFYSFKTVIYIDITQTRLEIIIMVFKEPHQYRVYLIPEPTLSIKLFKTMSLESNASWNVSQLKTDLSSGSMLSTYFEQKEGEWFSYIRSNSGAVDWNLRSANGLATSNNITGTPAATVINFASPIGSILSIGDSIYAKTNPPEKVGEITSLTSSSITVDASAVGAYLPQNGDFILSYKDSVAESQGARGYYMEFTLTNGSTSAVELFSVGSDIMKSYP